MLGVAIAFVFFFIPNYLGNVGISLPTTSFYFLVCGFTACFVCGFLKNRFAHILTSRTRVLIQAASTVVGLFVFALLPSAKTLVITSAFLGVALGIHDYYYIYVLYLICNGTVKANLRKLAEYTVYFGAGIMVPIIMVAFMVDNVRITFLVVSLIVAILAFLYPLSSFSGMIDERDLSLKPQKKGQEKPQAKAASRSRAPQAPVNAQAAVMPDGTVAVDAQAAAYIPEEQYVEPAQQYTEPVQQAPVDQQYQQYQQYQQAPVEQPYQQQYQQPYQQAYQDPYQQQYTQYQQQYQEPVQQQYQADPYGNQYSEAVAPQMPQGGMGAADPYAGSGPSPYDTTVSQGPVDPLAFLNNDGNEGGNQ